MTAEKTQPSANDPSAGERRSGRSPLIWTALLLAALLAIVFHRSFNLRYVAFSNDGPLGQMVTEMNKMPTVVMGLWVDVNWLGFEALSPPPGITSGMRWATSPQVYLNILYPTALFLVGIAACYCLRMFKLSGMACVLGGLAAAFNSDFFSTCCWGVASQIIGFAADYFAIGLLAGNGPRRRWVRLMLAGLAVGMGVMEAYDIGALFSLFVAGFVLYQALFLAEAKAAGFEKFGRGVMRVGMVAIFAAFISLSTLTLLVGTQIQGIVGTAQDKETKKQHWDMATQWSLPKVELCQLFIPGIFGHRMDSMDGVNYWGEIGRSPGLDELLKQRAAADEAGKAQIDASLRSSNYWRFTGTGLYAGVPVLLVALWGVMQSFRRRGSPYSLLQRRMIWFWAGIMAVTVPLSFGRYAPFYQFFYALPYASIIRNPVKFMHVFSWALIIVFGYGVHGLQQTYMNNAVERAKGFKEQLKRRRGMARFEKIYLGGCVAALALALIGWAIYSRSGERLKEHMIFTGIEPAIAPLAVKFSIHAVGWFVLFLALTLALMALIFSGQFAGARAKWGGALLGALLLADLIHADLPWPHYWDVAFKYASNPIIDLLREKPWEHRVTMNPLGKAGDQEFGLFQTLYSIEWQQQVFPYYEIQSLEMVMEPRLAVDKEMFLRAIPATGVTNFMRIWELTNTRYLVGIGGGVVDFLNRNYDPALKRFRIVQPFDLAPKPGANGVLITDYTAVTNGPGKLGLIEFSGALPRASLFSNWRVETNDDVTLNTLGDAMFDPHRLVLVATNLPAPLAGSVDASPGSVEITDYKSKRIEMSANVKAPSVLLVTDRYNPKWQAEVDGKPAPLLRCDFILRGVYLEPGRHRVVLRYVTPVGTLYVSFAAIVLAIGLCGILIFDRAGRRAEGSGKS